MESVWNGNGKIMEKINKIKMRRNGMELEWECRMELEWNIYEEI